MSGDEEFEELEEQDETSVYMYLIRYKGAYYMAECVEVTPDTAYFQVDPNLVRKGTFTSNRIDLRWFPEMGLTLIPVHHPPLLEQ